MTGASERPPLRGRGAPSSIEADSRGHYTEIGRFKAKNEAAQPFVRNLLGFLCFIACCAGALLALLGFNEQSAWSDARRFGDLAVSPLALTYWSYAAASIVTAILLGAASTVIRLLQDISDKLDR